MKIISIKLVVLALIAGTAFTLSATSTGGVSIPGDQTKLECCSIPDAQK